MTTSQVQSGTQDFETQGVQLPNADVVHAAGPATDVDQDRPRHWRPREPRVDHWCENHGPYIKGSRLHVLKTIGSYADLTTGIAVVGIETLAKVCQLHPRQVRRIIKDLAHKRFWFVIVERPRGNNKLGHSNEYHFSGAATQWTPVRQEINGFETKAEGNIRKLTLAIELLRSHGVEIPEELQDNSRGDISACPPNDDDEDNTEGTFSYVPSGYAPPTPDPHEHLNGVESSSSAGMTDWCTTPLMAAKAASNQPGNHDLSTNQGTEHGMDHHGQGQHRTNLEHPIPADDNRLHHATGTR